MEPTPAISQGEIDEVRVWNTARTQAQIQGSMNTEMSSPTANLVGRWGLDEGAGSAFADSSGNAVNGTTFNSPAWVDGFNVAPPSVARTALQFDGVERLRHRRSRNFPLRRHSSRSKPGSGGTGAGVTTSSGGTGGMTDVSR